MKRSLIFVFLVFFLSHFSFSQNASIKGVVIDTLNNKKLHHAAATLVRAKDSILVSFTRSNIDGVFEFNNLLSDKYILTISSPTYADYSELLTINNTDTNLGKIILTSKAKLLETVVVQQKIAAIRFKGDTLEYKADSFKLGANASVQDLLKKLPGISVNSKGEITAQGQEVKKVLVDGEEFFSDDPGVVIKGLRADAIDKVQVFDKKSDQATFTGIDDGVKDKTINLQMKDDKKRGYFGKLEAGSDFGDYRYGKAMVNAFKGKKKFAAYATADNTNFESLNWNEKSNYGEDLNRTVEVNDDGGVSMWSSGDNFSWGQGYPNSNSAGLHYSKKWKEDKHNLNNTYQYNQLSVFGGSNNNSQTLLADSISISNTDVENFDSYKRRNRMRSTYNVKFDSTSDFKIVATGSMINTLTSKENIGSSNNNKGNLLNNTLRKTISNATEKILITNLIWRKKFNKKGRTISWSFDGDFVDNKKNINLLALNNFYTGSTSNKQNINQFKIDNEDKYNIRTKLAYTEPLWKNTFLEINTSFNKNNNEAVRTTFNPNALDSSKYDFMVDSLSSNFNFSNYGFFGGSNFKYQGKKVKFNFGLNVGTTNLTVNDNLRTDNRNVNFTNWQPNIGFTYSPKKQRNLWFNYNGKNRNPNLSQIQPFLDNLIPIAIVKGNPNLQQEFTHSFSLNFSDYKVIKSKNFYVSSSYSFTNNAISNASIIDAKSGLTTNKAINVNGNSSFSLWSSYGFELTQSYSLSFSFNPTLNKNVNFINGTENVNKSERYRLRVSSYYKGDSWFDYWVGFGSTYNVSNSTINPIKTEYWLFNTDLDFTVKLKKQKIEFGFDASINIYKQENQFSRNANFAMLNFNFKKGIDKENKWELKLNVHDILNQNQNVNRSINSNSITENISRNIQRYAMFSLIYNFSKNGKPSSGW